MSHDDPTGSAIDLMEPEAAIKTPDLVNLAPSAPARVAGEPTGGVGTAPEVGVQLQPPIAELLPPQIPLPVATRNASGRYLGRLGSFQLEARVDVDGAHPLNMLSGDFFSISGGTTSYFGSFTVDNPTIIRTPTQVIARGLGRFTFGAGAPVVQVTVPRRIIFQPAAPATVQFFTTGGSPGASYVCAFEGVGMRRVAIETDVVSDVVTPVFNTYDTGLLPSGGPARTLSVASAYAEAGIEMVPTAGGGVINVAEAGADHAWSDAELHASMALHFSLFRNAPQWAVYQLVCQLHDGAAGAGLYGIMFDQFGPQRQGCAVFHAGIGGVTPEKQRLQLYTYVHELGHCFNLLHSWQKSFANPPAVNRPDALSWMNYPWNYPTGHPTGGAASFWNRFPFQFDPPELAHIRHGFRNHVIMGGDPFATNAAIIDPQVVADPLRDDSGLRVTIEPQHPNYALGEPVVVKLGLSVTDKRGKVAHPHLDPRTSMTSIAIRKPGGDVVAYEPFVDYLMDSQPQFLADGDVVEESAYIGHGAGGLYFDRPGTYKVRAIYQAPDGSPVYSNVADIKIRYPITQTDEELADLLIGEEQGALFSLLGSDSEALAAGNRAFDTVLEKYAKSPLADYVQAARGVHLARTFVTIDPSKPNGAEVRQPQIGASQELLAAATASDSRIDDLSKSSFLKKLARAQRKAGDEVGSNQTLSRAETLRPRRRPPSPR